MQMKKERFLSNSKTQTSKVGKRDRQKKGEKTINGFLAN
jgi:hypothetical protein